MQRIRADICVIGAGSGGLTVAAGAAQMGARVVLVEGAEMGGDCLNSGCVPSKALLWAAHLAQTIRQGGPGVAGRAKVDFAAVNDHVAASIARIAPHDSQERFEGLGVRVVRHWGRFVGRDALAAGPFHIRARRFVIATGSHARIPAIDGIESVPVLTNETIFTLREAPQHLLVLGGGPIGLELAQAHRRLGCAVTVIEAATCLAREDMAAAGLVLARLRAEGVAILEQTAVTRITPEAGITLHLAGGATVSGTHLLVATGRKPALDRLDLPTGGVAFTETGVTVGRNLRSISNRRVLAIGDAVGQGQFTHLAAYQAGIVLRRAMFGLPARMRSDHIPRVTYTDPELAQIGPTEAEARRAFGAGIQVLRADYDHNDRALTGTDWQGFVTLVVRRGRVIGATVVGAQAGEVIAPLVLAVSARVRIAALASMILPYPTLSELGKRAASAYFSEKLFDNPAVRGWVRLVQRILP